jgi:hypothetical protein
MEIGMNGQVSLFARLPGFESEARAFEHEERVKKKTLNNMAILERFFDEKDKKITVCKGNLQINEGLMQTTIHYFFDNPTQTCEAIKETWEQLLYWEEDGLMQVQLKDKNRLLSTCYAATLKFRDQHPQDQAVVTIVNTISSLIEQNFFHQLTPEAQESLKKEMGHKVEQENSLCASEVSFSPFPLTIIDVIKDPSNEPLHNWTLVDRCKKNQISPSTPIENSFVSAPSTQSTIEHLTHKFTESQIFSLTNQNPQMSLNVSIWNEEEPSNKSSHKDEQPDRCQD